jgi:sensor histidine kinase YesM
MGDRLEYAFEIGSALLTEAFPPMLLQPLVENAIRHGLEAKVEGGRVIVAARRQDARLLISVTDDGLGFAENCADGIGLANIRARLAAIYGPGARLDLTSKVGAGVTAMMSIPAGVAP